MRKSIIVLFVLLCCVSNVFADSIWMPADEYFRESFSPESDKTCESVTRDIFTVNAADGKADAFLTPLSNEIVGSYPNGTEIRVSWVCGVGDNRWGSVRAVRYPDEEEFTEDWEGKSGYLRMRDLEQAYDAQAFLEDHADEAQDIPETQQFDLSDGFILWRYPGSELIVYTCEKEYLEYLQGWAPFELKKLWTDEEGTLWGYMEMTRPIVTGWIDLDAPMYKISTVLGSK